MTGPIQLTPLICIRGAFPELTLDQSNAKMIELGQLVQDWLKQNSTLAENATITWINQIDRDNNPDGDIGYYTIHRP